MPRTRTVKIIDAKIKTFEDKLRRLKERGDKVARNLDLLYKQKEEIKRKELFVAIEKSTRTRAEILAFLASK